MKIKEKEQLRQKIVQNMLYSEKNNTYFVILHVYSDLVFHFYTDTANGQVS